MSNEGPGLASTVWGISESLGAAFDPTKPGNIGFSTPAQAEFTSVGVGTAPDGVTGDLICTVITAIFGVFTGSAQAPHFFWNLSTTVSGLPPATLANQGSTSLVSDAMAPAWGATVVGGGSSPALVWSNGSAWTVFAK